MFIMPIDKSGTGGGVNALKGIHGLKALNAAAIITKIFSKICFYSKNFVILQS